MISRSLSYWTDKSDNRLAPRRNRRSATRWNDASASSTNNISANSRSAAAAAARSDAATIRRPSRHRSPLASKCWPSSSPPSSPLSLTSWPEANFFFLPMSCSFSVICWPEEIVFGPNRYLRENSMPFFQCWGLLNYFTGALANDFWEVVLRHFI